MYAASAARAEDVLLKQGKTIVDGWTRPVTPPDQRGRAGPVMHDGPLQCRQCRYNFNGLSIPNNGVKCPECGYFQRLAIVEYRGVISDVLVPPSHADLKRFARTMVFLALGALFFTLVLVGLAIW